jgi:hypothetical protein
MYIHKFSSDASKWKQTALYWWRVPTLRWISLLLKPSDHKTLLVCSSALEVEEAADLWVQRKCLSVVTATRDRRDHSEATRQGSHIWVSAGWTKGHICYKEVSEWWVTWLLSIENWTFTELSLPTICLLLWGERQNFLSLCIFDETWALVRFFCQEVNNRFCV